MKIHRIPIRESAARLRYWLHTLCTSRYGIRLIYPLLREFCRRDASPGFLHHLYPWLHPYPPRPRTKPRQPGRRILIIRPDHIGDFLYSLPAMLRIREGLSADDELGALIDPCNAALAERLGLFDEIIVFRIFSEAGHKLLPSRREYLRLRQVVGEVDVAIDLRPDGHSGCTLDRLLPAKTYRIRNRQDEIVERLGSSGGQTWVRAPDKPDEYWFLSHAIASARARLMFDFAEAVAGGHGPAHADVFGDAGRRAAALLRRHFSGEAEGTLVICPEARNRDKEWPAAKTLALVHELMRRGCQLRIIGERKLPAFPDLPVGWDLRGRTTLLEALKTIARAEAFIGFDSGPAHFASLLGVPAVTIFNGTTDPTLWAGVHSEGLGWTIWPSIPEGRARRGTTAGYWAQRGDQAPELREGSVEAVLACVDQALSHGAIK